MSCVSRPSRPSQCETHRAAPGDGAPLAGAAAEAKPPRLSPTVCQGAPENDRPAADRHRPRPPHPAPEEDRGGHVPTPAAAGDHEGLVLDCTRRNEENRGRRDKKKGLFKSWVVK